MVKFIGNSSIYEEVDLEMVKNQVNEMEMKQIAEAVENTEDNVYEHIEL